LTTRTNSLLTASGINKSFKVGKNTLDVLKDVEFAIDSGELVALMGPSGSGKSTLLNIVGGLLESDDGYVELDGYRYGKKKPIHLDDLRRNKIGWIFQNSNLLEHLDVKDNVAFALWPSSAHCPACGYEYDTEEADTCATCGALRARAT